MESAQLAIRMGYCSAAALVVGWLTVLFEVRPFSAPSDRPGIDRAFDDFIAALLSFMAPGGGVAQFSLLGGIYQLLVEGYVALALLLTIVSVVFPSLKLGIALYALHTTGEMTPRQADILKLIGPWSLLDLLVVSVIIVAAKGLPFSTSVHPGVGFWGFLISIVLAWLCTALSPVRGHAGPSDA